MTGGNQDPDSSLRLDDVRLRLARRYWRHGRQLVRRLLGAGRLWTRRHGRVQLRAVVRKVGTDEVASGERGEERQFTSHDGSGSIRVYISYRAESEGSYPKESYRRPTTF